MKNQSIQGLVRMILDNPLAYDWSLQGFGMFRVYLPGVDTRLHIWDSRFRVDEVSDIHTHPWHFASTVVFGKVTNERLREVEGDNWHRQLIMCGVGGGPAGDPTPIGLELASSQHLPAGSVYTQRADEIHRSVPEDGTVTIVERTVVSGDGCHAHVYHRANQPWVSAEPRPASVNEILTACDLVLEKNS